MNNKLPESTDKSSPDPYWKRYLNNTDDDTKKRLRKENIETQMVVYRSIPDDAIFDDWIQWLEAELVKLKQPANAINIISVCGNCNESLMLLVGEGVKTFVTTEGAVKGVGTSSPPGSTGDRNGIYRSANFNFGIPLKDQTMDKGYGESSQVPLVISKKKPVKVAVLDTGLAEVELDKYIVSPNPNPCIPTASQGWNFTTDKPRVDDDHGIKHGTVVSRILVDQSRQTANGNPIQIIPIKVQNADGVSDLYDVMCAMAYAKSMDAQVINASFGFYAPLDYAVKDTFCVEIFRKFIKDVLTDNAILLVAAAGNLTDQAIIRKLFNPNAIGAAEPLYHAPENTRSLDEIHFFPASFAAEPELWNVISVTTVTPEITKVSDGTNYSVHVVDIGVPADIDEHDGFANPRQANTFVAGSSFAAPKVTGLIAANFDLIAGKRSKEDIFTTLTQNNLIAPVPNNILVKRAVMVRQISESLS